MLVFSSADGIFVLFSSYVGPGIKAFPKQSGIKYKLDSNSGSLFTSATPEKSRRTLILNINFQSFDFEK